MRRTLAIVAALAFAGCVDQGTAPVTQYDEAFYATSVQPFVGHGCGSLDCHGVGRRPLRIYAEDGLRIDDALRGEPITAAELAWNVAAFEAVDPEPASPEQHIALLKPLPVDAGGMHHLGDPAFTGDQDPGYRCLRGWLSGDTSTEVAAACADAADAAVAQ